MKCYVPKIRHSLFIILSSIVFFCKINLGVEDPLYSSNLMRMKHDEMYFGLCYGTYSIISYQSDQ
jgi:hypothetical protein